MERFGERLKKTMETRDMSASELSRTSGVGKNLISYYIHGRCLAKQDKVFLLAKALGVDPGWLMTGVEPKRETEQFPIVVPDSERFVKLTKCMTNEEYVTVMQIFEKAEKRLKEKEGE